MRSRPDPLAMAGRISGQILSKRGYSVVHDVPRMSTGLNQPQPLLHSRSSSVFQEAIDANVPRTNWTKDEITQIHQKPLMELAFAAVCIFILTLMIMKANNAAIG